MPKYIKKSKEKEPGNFRIALEENKNKGKSYTIILNTVKQFYY